MERKGKRQGKRKEEKMSTNLWCKEVELRQTPTYITEMIYFNHREEPDDWRNIRYRYLKWLKGQMLYDGKISKKEFDYRKQLYEAHKKILMSYKKLTFDIT